MPQSNTLLLGAVSGINMLTGIAFQWLLLTMLGPGVHSDALFAAMTVPQLFATVIASAIAQVLVPILAGETSEDARRTAWSFVAVSWPLCAAAAGGLILAAPWWVPVTVAGFSEVGKAEAVQLTQVMIGGIMFTGLIAVQQAAAYARGSYVWPDLAQALSNLIALGMLVVMLPKYGVVAAAWITLGRVGLQCLLTMNELGKWIRPDRNDPALKTSWRRMRPLILGASYYKMDPLIDRFLLSGLAPGSLSLFALAQQLHGAGSQIVTRAIGTPAQTKMAVAFKREDNASVGSTLRSGFWAATAFCAVCIIVLALVGQPILTLLFGQGEFASGQVKQLWLVLLLSSAVFILGASSSILAGAFYVRGDTRSPTLLGSASFTLSIVLKIVMYRQFGIYGLALAVSFQYVLSACLLAGRLQRLGVVSWLSWDRSH